MRAVKRSDVRAIFDGKNSKLIHKKTKELLWQSRGYEHLREMYTKFCEKKNSENRD